MEQQFMKHDHVAGLVIGNSEMKSERAHRSLHPACKSVETSDVFFQIQVSGSDTSRPPSVSRHAETSTRNSGTPSSCSQHNTPTVTGKDELEQRIQALLTTADSHKANKTPTSDVKELVDC